MLLHIQRDKTAFLTQFQKCIFEKNNVNLANKKPYIRRQLNNEKCSNIGRSRRILFSFLEIKNFAIFRITLCLPEAFIVSIGRSWQSNKDFCGI